MRKNKDAVQRPDAGTLKKYAEAWQALYGNEVISIILYGSAARDDYQPAHSDINMLVTLTDAGMAKLHKAVPLVQTWSRRQFATPLVLTTDFINDSLDSFPIEFLSMRLNHRLVYGAPVLDALKLDPAELRVQLEREFKGKLLHLREGMLAAGDDVDAIRNLIDQSLHSFFPLFETMLHLAGLPVPPRQRETAASAAELAGLQSNSFDAIYDAPTSGKSGSVPLAATLQAYIGYIESLSQFANRNLHITEEGITI